MSSISLEIFIELVYVISVQSNRNQTIFKIDIAIIFCFPSVQFFTMAAFITANNQIFEIKICSIMLGEAERREFQDFN